jgi:hypothetical protein
MEEATERPYSLCVEFQQLFAQPVPVWAAKMDTKTNRYNKAPLGHAELRKTFDVLHRSVKFRGVELDRLPTVLAAGVDVEPTTAPIFVSDFEKAWEYGGLPKAVMAFDGKLLEPTYREVIVAETTDDEIVKLMADYPTRIEVASGERLHLSRFPETDPRAASRYEMEYARWIPGDPFEALVAVFLFLSDGS